MSNHDSKDTNDFCDQAIELGYRAANRLSMGMSKDDVISDLEKTHNREMISLAMGVAQTIIAPHFKVS